MKVLELLKKAGLVQVREEGKTQEHIVFPTKTVSIADLQTKYEEEKQNMLASFAPELSVPFEKIFEAMKITVPAHGWNSDKIQELLESPDLKEKPEGERKKVILEKLASHQVKEEEILQDAVARDRALDRYEEFVVHKIKHRSEKRQSEIRKLQEEIREAEKKIKMLQKSEEQEENNLKEWQKKKLEKEEELVKIASVFTGDHGITLGNKK